MNALEFTAIIHDGVVEIPPQYRSQWNKKQVRVIFLEADGQLNQCETIPAESVNANDDSPLPRKAGVLKGRITIAQDFNEPRNTTMPGFGVTVHSI